MRSRFSTLTPPGGYQKDKKKDKEVEEEDAGRDEGKKVEKEKEGKAEVKKKEKEKKKVEVVEEGEKKEKKVKVDGEKCNVKEIVAAEAEEGAKKASSSASSASAEPKSPTGTAPPASSSSNSGPKDRALQKNTIPEIYPQVMAVPIAKRPLFPGFYKAVSIRDPQVAAAIQEMMKRGQPYIGAFLFKDENMDKDTIDSIDEVHPVGVFAQITSTSTFPVHHDGETSLTAVLYPHRRIKISKLLPPRGMDATGGFMSAEITEVEEAAMTPVEEDVIETEQEKGDVVASFEEIIDETPPAAAPISPYATSFLKKFNVSLVDVENLTEQPYDKKSPIIRAVTSEIVNVFKEVANLNPLFRDQISTFSMSQSAGNVIDEPAKLADFAAAVSAGEVKELQDVLETLDVEERLSKALVVLKKELMNAQLQSKISKDVEAKIQKRQREYWLMEQMKGIRRELGIESDGKDKLVERFKEKAEKLAMPEAVKKVFDEELNKLAHLESAASEFNVTRNYLDWLTQIPWGQQSTENYSIKNAMTVLDEDHHGLKDVKDRILEFIAVGKLRGSVEGKILCLTGPPGET